MTYALAVVIVLVVVAFVWFLRDEREANARLLAQQAKDYEIERDKLLNRIQAPQSALAAAWTNPDPEPKYIPLEDDARMLEYFQERG